MSGAPAEKPAAKKEGPKPEEAGHAPEAGHATPGAAKDTWFSKIPEGLWRGGKAVVLGIAGFFGKRIKGAATGAWEATGGQVTGELGEAAHRLGFESKETGPLNAIAGVIEGVGKRVASVVGGVVDFTIGAPARAAGRVLRGAQNVVTGAILGKTFGKGGESSAEAAAAAGAHPAH